jgi:FtsZ-binding cell division protein ZapB
MTKLIIFLALTAFSIRAKAEAQDNCTRFDAKLKPSERIERLEQRVLACDVDLRMVAQEKEEKMTSLGDCRRLNDHYESEAGKLKDELQRANDKRFKLEDANKDLQERLNAVVGKYEVVSTAILIGAFLIIGLIGISMAWVYAKYRKLLAPKRTF